MKAALAAAGFVFASSAANAGSIYTPMIFMGNTDQLVCVVVNVSNAPITVNVRITGVLGNVADTCTLQPLDADGSCQVFRNNDAGFCRITVSGLTAAQVAARVRGTLFARKTTAPFSVESVVQAQP